MNNCDGILLVYADFGSCLMVAWGLAANVEMEKGRVRNLKHEKSLHSQTWTAGSLSKCHQCKASIYQDSPSTLCIPLSGTICPHFGTVILSMDLANVKNPIRIVFFPPGAPWQLKPLLVSTRPSRSQVQSKQHEGFFAQGPLLYYFQVDN